MKGTTVGTRSLCSLLNSCLFSLFIEKQESVVNENPFIEVFFPSKNTKYWKVSGSQRNVSNLIICKMVKTLILNMILCIRERFV